MRRCCLAAVMLVVPAVWANALPGPSPSASDQFRAIYRHYAAALQAKGAGGLGALLAPDFRFRDEGRWLTGREALAAIDEHGHMLPGSTISVRLRRVRVSGSTASIVADETHTVPSGKTASSRSPEGATVVITGPVSMFFAWKQTWRKTPKGWQMASMEPTPDSRASGTAGIRIKYTR